MVNRQVSRITNHWKIAILFTGLEQNTVNVIKLLYISGAINYKDNKNNATIMVLHGCILIYFLRKHMFLLNKITHDPDLRIFFDSIKSKNCHLYYPHYEFLASDK